MAEALRIYLIAGEASGDLLGAHLMRSLKAQSSRPIKFFGIGGPRMEAEGLKSLFPYQELSLLGFVEVLPHAMRIFARVNYTVADVLAKQPDMTVTIDVPGFSFRVVKKLRKQKCMGKFIHYVAPTVWAYKPQRAKLCAELYDHLLTLLPFEKPYFDKVGLPCTFVGHPVVAETPIGDGPGFRKRNEISDSALVISMLPGSRKGEIVRHMPIFARAVGMLSTLHPNIALAVSVPRHALPIVAPYFEECPFRAVITSNEQDKKDAIAASNMAIVKSGTVALEVAMAHVPMLIAYRVNAISAWMLRRITTTKFVNLVNIILQREAIPEFLQEMCEPSILASSSAELLRNEKMREGQKAQAASALAQMVPADGQKPSDLAARIVLGTEAKA